MNEYGRVCTQKGHMRTSGSTEHQLPKSGWQAAEVGLGMPHTHHLGEHTHFRPISVLWLDVMFIPLTVKVQHTEPAEDPDLNRSICRGGMVTI